METINRGQLTKRTLLDVKIVDGTLNYNDYGTN